MASLPVATKLGNALPISQASVRCCISWRRLQLAAYPDLHLTALLADASGEELGVVNRELRENARNVAEQWEACGVKHVAVTGNTMVDERHALEGTEEIEINFSATANGLIDFVFLLISAPGVRAVKELASALLEVSGCDCRLDLVADSEVKSCNLMVAYIFCRGGDGNSWSLVDARFPVEGSGSDRKIPAALLQEFATAAKSKASNHSAQVPSAQVLQEEVSELMKRGEYAEALKKQETLVQIVADSGHSPTTTQEAINLLCDLQQRAQGANGSSSSASVTSSVAPHELAAQQESIAKNRLEQARIEPLDNCGYQEVRALADPAAMSEYISRAFAANGWLVDEMRIMGIVTTELPDTYDQLLELARPTDVGASLGHKEIVQPPAENVSGSSSGYPPRNSALSASVQDRPALMPPGGSLSGGDEVRWIAGGGLLPEELRIGGRPCAAMEDNVFVTPMGRRGHGAQDVVAIYADGREEKIVDGFCYWEPGDILELDPDKGPMEGGCEVGIVTNDLGAPITEVTIGGIVCDHATKPSSTTADVVLPPVETDGTVAVVVKAANGNSARRDCGFFYYPPEEFGSVGQNIELSNDNRTARRRENINGGVCLGARPLRRCDEGRYFEVVLTEWATSLQAMAIGVAAAQDKDEILVAGRIRADEGRRLKRVWLAGYDSKGALFINDEASEPIPEKAWRPVKDLRPSADQTPIRLGVLWSEPADNLTAAPALVIFQDGVEKVRLTAGGRLPARSEDLYALVDLLGNVKCASIVEGALPPQL